MKWIISNHKNALDDDVVVDYVNTLNNVELNGINLVICPKDSHLSYFSGNYYLGCQDVNLSFADMKKNNIKFSIVGHSYKRKNYNESNILINKKIKDLLINGITPILCIGEEVNNNLKDTLLTELKEGLDGVSGDVIIAYEPVWAIGSGMIPNIEVLNDTVDFIDRQATRLLGRKPIILYGGSVNKDTITLLECVHELDGYLIGNASVEIDKLVELIEVIK